MSTIKEGAKMTTQEEDNLAMELAKATFIKQIKDNIGELPVSPYIFRAIEQCFETGFKVGVAWRDEPEESNAKTQ